MITAKRKGGRKTGDLSSTLAEELNSKTAFTIPVFGGIPIAECVVVTWVIMAVLVILSLILVRNLSVENPGKKQLLLESGVSFLQDFFMGILGEEGKQYQDHRTKNRDLLKSESREDTAICDISHVNGRIFHNAGDKNKTGHQTYHNCIPELRSLFPECRHL